MKPEEIMEMAMNSGLPSKEAAKHNLWWLQAFAKLVAAKEREACADIAENWRSNGMPRTGVADAIRARGERDL